MMARLDNGWCLGPEQIKDVQSVDQKVLKQNTKTRSSNQWLMTQQPQDVLSKSRY